MSNITLAGSKDPSTGGRDLWFAGGIVAILSLFFLPVPAILIDLGLALSIALSVLILMVALWIQRPLDFSAFPTILLVATMLRLSLNIATTRLILSHGADGTTAAGYIISGFSNLVIVNIGVHPSLVARLKFLRERLEENRKVLALHLKAAEEIADLISGTLEDAASDGTYTATIFRGRHT